HLHARGANYTPHAPLGGAPLRLLPRLPLRERARPPRQREDGGLPPGPPGAGGAADGAREAHARGHGPARAARDDAPQPRGPAREEDGAPDRDRREERSEEHTS